MTTARQATLNAVRNEIRGLQRIERMLIEEIADEKLKETEGAYKYYALAANAFELTIKNVVRKTKSHPFVHAKMLARYLAFQEMESVSSVATLFGCDRGSVANSIRSVESWPKYGLDICKDALKRLEQIQSNAKLELPETNDNKI